MPHLFHNVIITFADGLQELICFFGRCTSSDSLRFRQWSFTMSVSIRNASGGRWSDIWRDLWREHPSTSRYLTSPNNVSHIRFVIFRSFDRLKFLLNSLYKNLSTIIPRDSLVRGIWYRTRLSDNNR